MVDVGKGGDVKLYHHDADGRLRRHIDEVPKQFREVFLRFVRYCRRTGVRDISLYTYLPKLRDFLLYLQEEGVNNVCDFD